MFFGEKFKFHVPETKVCLLALIFLQVGSFLHCFSVKIPIYSISECQRHWKQGQIPCPLLRKILNAMKMSFHFFSLAGDDKLTVLRLISDKELHLDRNK